MHVLVIVATVVWFVLVGLLWYARPGEVMWLVGSLVLGAATSRAFSGT